MKKVDALILLAMSVVFNLASLYAASRGEYFLGFAGLFFAQISLIQAYLIEKESND